MQALQGIGTMAKSKRSIPENMSFEPEVVKRDIEELERLAARSELSAAGYAELTILKLVAEAQKQSPAERS